MSPSISVLERFIRRLATAASLFVALVFLTGVGLIDYQGLMNDLEFKAFVKATALNNLVASLPDVWYFAENRINGLIAREPVPLTDEHVEVFDNADELLTSTGVEISGARLARHHPLNDGPRIVGYVVVSRPARVLFDHILLAILAGISLGVLVLLVLRFVPLRALKRVEEDLFQSEERAGITLSAISDAVIVMDADGNITYLNPAAMHILGCSLAAVQGHTVSDILKLQDAHSGSALEGCHATVLRNHKPAAAQGRSILIRADGQEMTVEQQAAPVFNRQGKLTGVVLCLHDISEIQALIEQTSWEASHDPLTSLFNRREFTQRVSRALADAQISGQTHVVFYMDLDRFKVVNDSCGHAAGDQLLTDLCALMKARLRTSDILARLGGDEFGLLLMGCNLEHGQTIASDIIATVSEHVFHWQAQNFQVGISIGLSMIGRYTTSADAVLREADSACYLAKESADGIYVYRITDNELASRRNEAGWVTRITEALRQDHFVLYQQKIVPLQPEKNDRMHLEILLRMLDEQGAIILPNRFLAVAERYNLMPQIDRWVIAHSFAAFPAIAARHKEKLPLININLSGTSVTSSGLMEYICQQAAIHAIDPGAVCFEITETVAMRNISRAIDFIQECKRCGFSLALDDFGTGTSFFSYLRSLPVDYLKIDGGFVRNIATDSIDRAMVKVMNEIAHRMGQMTIAEFAENEDVIHILRDMGVDYAQGYGIDYPRPVFEQELC